MTIPCVVFGNDELALKPDAGTHIECRKCGKKHKIKYGKSQTYDHVTKKCGPWVKSKTLGFYTCGKSTYLASVAGKLV